MRRAQRLMPRMLMRTAPARSRHAVVNNPDTASAMRPSTEVLVERSAPGRKASEHHRQRAATAGASAHLRESKIRRCIDDRGIAPRPAADIGAGSQAPPGCAIARQFGGGGMMRFFLFFAEGVVPGQAEPPGTKSSQGPVAESGCTLLASDAMRASIPCVVDRVRDQCAEKSCRAAPPRADK